MRVVIFLLLNMLVFALCLPGLKPPQEFQAINLLSQLLNSSQEIVPPYRISLIYNGRTYNPGDTIDLGMGDPFKPISRNFILRNSGQFAFSIDDNGPPTITSSSTGSLSLKSNSQIPASWEPGNEFSIDLTAIPAAESENLWNVKILIVLPEAIDQEFNFKILSTPIRTGRLYFSITNPLTDRGVWSQEFNSTTESLGVETLHINNPSTFRLVPSEYNRYMYYGRMTPAQIEGNFIDSNGTIQFIAPNADTTLNASFTNGSYIPNRNRLLSLGGSANLITTPYNSNSGLLGTPAGPFGTQCVSKLIKSTPNGDFIIQPHGNTIGIPGRFQVGKLETDGTLTNVYPSPFYYEDPILSNRLSIWWKNLTMDYLYFVSHTSTPGVNNLKVDFILRRTMNSDGSFSEVDNEYMIGEPGGYYTEVLRHPNDRWIYILGGNSSTNNPILLHYSIELDSGYPEKIQTYSFGGFVPILLGSISPDGKYLALVVKANNSPCPTCSQTLKLFRIGMAGELTEIYSQAYNREFSDINWLSSP